MSVGGSSPCLLNLGTLKIISLGLLRVLMAPNFDGDRRLLWDELAGMLN
jgi:hypothetical protein